MESDGPTTNGQPEKTPDSTSDADRLAKELAASKSTVAALESQISSHADERNELTLQIKSLKSQVASMEAVVAHVADLEGDVSRLQHDLGSSAAENDDLAAEVGKLKSLVADLMAKVDSLEKERDELADGMGRKVEEFERKLEKADKELEVKEEEIKGAQKLAGDAIAELEALQGSMDEFNKVKEREIAEDDENCKKKECEGLMSPLGLAVVSIGTVVIAGAVCYLRSSKER